MLMKRSRQLKVVSDSVVLAQALTPKLLFPYDYKLLKGETLPHHAFMKSANRSKNAFDWTRERKGRSHYRTTQSRKRMPESQPPSAPFLRNPPVCCLVGSRIHIVTFILIDCSGETGGGGWGT